MNKTADVLSAALRFALRGGAPIVCRDPALLAAAFELAARHDLSHLVTEALDGAGLLEPGSPLGREFADKCRRARLMAVYRSERRRYETDRLRAAFQRARIPFIPLKGSVLCRLYPEEWMRTSHDVDVLVRTEDLDRALELLTAELEYKRAARSSHDVTLTSPCGVYLELHHSLLDSTRGTPAAALLDSLWERAYPLDGYEYALPDEIFLLLHVAHMAEHFECGGCGIRPFLDLRLWLDSVAADAEDGIPLRFRQILRDGGLLSFAEACLRLADYFMLGTPVSDGSALFLDFILRGGVYGNLVNRIAVGEAKRGGKGYILSRIFLPYDRLVGIYPIIKKYPILFPFMQVARWFSGFKREGLRRYTNEVRLTGKLKKRQLEAMVSLRGYLGL